MQTIPNPTRTEARAIINAEAQKAAVVVYFTKRDGTTRRMVCRVDGQAMSRKPYLLTVWDMEKGAVRSINLDTVSRIVLPGTRPAPAPDRAPMPGKGGMSAQQMRQMLHEIF